MTAHFGGYMPAPESFPCSLWRMPGIAAVCCALSFSPLSHSQAEAVESKPLRTTVPDYSAEQEAKQVAKLHQLLQAYYTEAEEASNTQPTPTELAEREKASRELEATTRIPFNADKVRLSGAEGSTALSEITRRLNDPKIPESRRDSAPICSIKTHLFSTLIASDRLSLKPAGKHHYVAKVRLQPGDTTVRVQGHRWKIRLPDDINVSEYLITLYKPPGNAPEFHIFSVDELLAEDQAHIPPWLPDELQIDKRPG